MRSFSSTRGVGERGEAFSIKLNTMPIGNHWNGVLKLLPPYNEDEDEAGQG